MITNSEIEQWTSRGWWIKIKDDDSVYSGWVGIGSDNKIYVDTASGRKLMPLWKFNNAHIGINNTVVIYAQGMIHAN